MSFTSVVLVLNEVVLVLLLDIAWETCGSTKSPSPGETPEYESDQRRPGNDGVFVAKWSCPAKIPTLLFCAWHYLPFLLGTVSFLCSALWVVAAIGEVVPLSQPSLPRSVERSEGRVSAKHVLFATPDSHTRERGEAKHGAVGKRSGATSTVSVVPWHWGRSCTAGHSRALSRLQSPDPVPIGRVRPRAIRDARV